jgi:hypothetical protein
MRLAALAAVSTTYKNLMATPEIRSAREAVDRLMPIGRVLGRKISRRRRRKASLVRMLAHQLASPHLH